MLPRLLPLLLLLACGPPDPGPGGGRDRTDPLEVELALPERAAVLSDLEAVATTAEGVPVAWSWTRDGQPTAITGPVVPAADTAMGEVWRVTATATDGDRTAEASAEVLIDHLGGNVLILLVDDLGVDKVGLYGVGSVVAPTPTLDALASDGVLFRNAWVQPTCSPTRASLLTGRYPRRTGIGRWIMPPQEPTNFDPDEVILPEMLAASPEAWSDAALGKWHLTGYQANPEPGTDPLHAGFSFFQGTLGNPDNSSLDPMGLPKGYRYWERDDNGELSFTTDYLTSSTTDDALTQLATLPEPWLMYVAYSAPHSPWHVPPADLHHYVLDEATASVPDKYDAMVESLDTEMGRLLDGMDPEVRARTTIVFLSDNGSPDDVIRPPLDPTRCKGTLYEGGVNVPMIVTGPAVTEPGTETLALVESVDLFATVAEIAGVALEEVIDPRTAAPVRHDGVSFLDHVRDPDLPSTRTRAYTSQHYQNGPGPYSYQHDSLRDERYKVGYLSSGIWGFFEYIEPFDEGPELLGLGPLSADQQEAYDRLSAELLERIGTLEYGP